MLASAPVPTSSVARPGPRDANGRRRNPPKKTQEERIKSGRKRCLSHSFETGRQGVRPPCKSSGAVTGRNGKYGPPQLAVVVVAEETSVPVRSSTAAKANVAPIAGRPQARIPPGDGFGSTALTRSSSSSLSSSSFSTRNSKAPPSSSEITVVSPPPIPSPEEGTLQSLHTLPSRPVIFVDSFVDLPDRLSVMIRLDSSIAYRCNPRRFSTLSDRAGSPIGQDELGSKEEDCQSVGVKELRCCYSEWRQRMAEWSYQVVDHFGYDREVVALSMSFLDRYLSSGSVEKINSTSTFQLLAVSTLFLSCKLHCNVSSDCFHPQQGPLRVSTLVELSRGLFIPEQVEATEMLILSQLGWRVHPPTALAFAKHLIILLPRDACTPRERGELEAKSNFLLELSVMDGAFVGYKRSTIALAAIAISFKFSDEIRHVFADAIYNVAGLDLNDVKVAECAIRLSKISIWMANNKAWHTRKPAWWGTKILLPLKICGTGPIQSQIYGSHQIVTAALWASLMGIYFASQVKSVRFKHDGVSNTMQMLGSFVTSPDGRNALLFYLSFSPNFCCHDLRIYNFSVGIKKN